MISRRDKPRVLIYILLLSSLLFSYITACSNNGGTVTAEQTGLITVTVKANLFSSVPEGQGTTPCTYSFDFNYTAGAKETLKAHETISGLQFMCLNGTPASNQGIETTFTFDPNDTEVLAGGVIKVFFARPGATILDDVLLTAYSGTLNFIAQETIRNGGGTLVIDASSLNDAILSSGVLEFAGGLSCPAAIFVDSLCTNGCLGSELLSLLGCEDDGGGGTKDCGNGVLDKDKEQCDPSSSGKPLCPASDCIAPGQPLECFCKNRCGNGIYEEEIGELCETCPAGRNCGALPVCPGGDSCVNCQCGVASECGNGVLEVGEECETCPPGKICGPIPATCDVGIGCVDCQCEIASLCGNGIPDLGEQCGEPSFPASCPPGSSCVDCQCMGPVCPACHIPPCPPENVVGSCNDGCDNDGDGSSDCNDHPDCDGDLACQSTCGNGILEGGPTSGEQCETCPPGMLCGPLPTCDLGKSCVDCQCVGSCPYGTSPEVYCDDGCDNDNDGSTDCDDHPDCDGDPACAACVCPPCRPPTTCNTNTCSCDLPPDCSAVGACGLKGCPPGGNCIFDSNTFACKCGV